MDRLPGAEDLVRRPAHLRLDAQVGHDGPHVDLAGPLGDLLRQLLRSVGVPADQDQMRAALGERQRR